VLISSLENARLVADPRFAGFKKVNRSLSIQDISTLVETFEHLLSEGILAKSIGDVIENSSGYFIFILDCPKKPFDFYAFLNSHYVNSEIISCSNVKWLFPRSQSKGIFQDNIFDEVIQDDDEDSTGFMDCNEDLPVAEQGFVCNLYHVRTNRSIPIPSNGIVIGRLSKYSDYVISDNSNVSRKHCKLYKQGSVVKIHDFDTPNGTFVNDLKVSSASDITLHIGDTILLADEEFTVN